MLGKKTPRFMTLMLSSLYLTQFLIHFFFFLPSFWVSATIDIKNLTPELQKDVKELQKRMATELKPLALETTLTLQKILEAKTHSQRVKTLRLFVEAESRRLKAKHLLRGMFTGSVGGNKGDVVNKFSTTSTMQPINSSILIDEPDAFQ